MLCHFKYNEAIESKDLYSINDEKNIKNMILIKTCFFLIKNEIFVKKRDPTLIKKLLENNFGLVMVSIGLPTRNLQGFIFLISCIQWVH